MPGAHFKRQALIWRKLTKDMVDKPFQAVKERMANGISISCFAQNELEELQQSANPDPDYENTIKNVAAISYAGWSLFFLFKNACMLSRDTVGGADTVRHFL